MNFTVLLMTAVYHTHGPVISLKTALTAPMNRKNYVMVTLFLENFIQMSGCLLVS